MIVEEETGLVRTVIGLTEDDWAKMAEGGIYVSKSDDARMIIVLRGKNEEAVKAGIGELNRLIANKDDVEGSE